MDLLTALKKYESWITMVLTVAGLAMPFLPAGSAGVKVLLMVISLLGAYGFHAKSMEVEKEKIKLETAKVARETTLAKIKSAKE